MHRTLVLLALMAACNRDKEGTPLPDAGALEPVSVLWEGAEFAGSSPSVLRLNDAWHMYLTATEGSIVGTMHATSTDGINFELHSSHRVVDDLAASDGEAVASVVSYASGSRAHLLLNYQTESGDSVRHATSTDGHTFTLEEGDLFSAGSPAAIAVTGAVYEAGTVTALVDEDDGTHAAPFVQVARSADGGSTFDEPTLALQPDDLPTPWGSETVGAGGMWSAALTVQEDGSYNMLFLGAAPNGSEAIGIGQAWSGDGEVWTSTGDLWYAPEDGQTINGLSLVARDGGYELWLGMSATDADPLLSGAFYHMRIE